mmetsp:Transcript_28585/g.65349  ORF Transcript_28585/g.65349 Transcript_28585/m.65349 type:complete len:493 (-) Transcript_28585:797-2275(-)
MNVKTATWLFIGATVLNALNLFFMHSNTRHPVDRISFFVKHIHEEFAVEGIVEGKENVSKQAEKGTIEKRRFRLPKKLKKQLIRAENKKLRRPLSDVIVPLEYTFTPETKSKKTSMTFSPWLKKYFEFHSSSIENGRIKDGVRYIVYECTGDEFCGGLGDRVIGIIKTLYLAILTNRVLLLDSPYPVPLDRVLNPSFMAWNASFPKTEEEVYMYNMSMIEEYDNMLGYRVLQTNGKYSYRLAEILHSSLMSKYLESNGFSSHDAPLVLSVAHAFYEAFWGLFKFDEKVFLRAEQIKLEAKLPRNGTDVLPYIGLHHRHGDHAIFETKKLFKFRFVNTNITRQCYNIIKGIFPNDGVFNASAYIASDSAAIKELMHDEDPSIHYHNELQIFHVDRSARQDTINKVKITSVLQGVIDAVAEIVILVDSECLIMSKSMFSFLAYYIRGPKNRCNIPVQLCNAKSVTYKSNFYCYESGDKYVFNVRDPSQKKMCQL